MDNFAERLKELRIDKNLTQTQLSKETGLSQACIAKLENGSRAPSVDTIIALAKFFKVTTDYLLGLE